MINRKMFCMRDHECWIEYIINQEDMRFSKELNIHLRTLVIYKLL